MYFLAPMPSRQSQTATWENGFSDSEIAQICTMGDAAPKVPPYVGNDDNRLVDEYVRKCDISWVHQNDESVWLYDKVGFIVRQLNSQFFNFDLTGFAEPFQHAKYNSTSEDHFGWHIDQMPDTGTVPRKLSLVIQLSDPTEYEGGDLEIRTSSNTPMVVEKKKGLVIAFPSFVWHRVTPVTAGTRRTLTLWVGGPAFK